MRFLTPFFAAALLTPLFADPAEARRGSGYEESLEFITMSSAIGQNGEPLALCAHVRTDTVLFFDLWRSQKGYALAENRCAVDQFFPVDAAQLAELKADGLVPADLPEIPDVKTGLAVPLWLWAVLAGLGGVALLKLRAKAGRKSERQALMGNASPGAVAILDAMCHAAAVDGRLDPGEVAEIVKAAEQMTGEQFDPQAVAKMASLAEANLTDSDFKRFVSGRSPAEIDVMMRGVLHVAVADGHLDGKEKQFVGKLASAMRMTSDQLQIMVGEVLAARAGGTPAE